MSIGDFVVLEYGSTNGRGSRLCNTATGAASTIINPGEPVVRGASATTVTRLYSTATTGIASPVVNTDFIVGIAQTTSTQTTTAAGVVDVLPVNSGVTFLANPTVAITTQAAYDALVGKRVLIDLGTLATGAYSVLAVDGSTSGVVIMPMDISKNLGKIAVAFRAGVSDLA
jgi:hypothetical protein